MTTRYCLIIHTPNYHPDPHTAPSHECPRDSALEVLENLTAQQVAEEMAKRDHLFGNCDYVLVHQADYPDDIPKDIEDMRWSALLALKIEERKKWEAKAITESDEYQEALFKLMARQSS